MNSKNFCRFEVLHNDRLAHYLSAIGLWAITVSDAIPKADVDTSHVYRFLVADWRELCNRVDNFNIHVIAIGMDDADLCVEAFRQGCFDYVRSVNFVELGARFQRLARRCQEWVIPTSRYWQLGNDIVLDTASFAVRKNGVFVPLTSKAFLVLAILEDDRFIQRARLAQSVRVSSKGASQLVVQVNRVLGRIVESRYKYGYKLAIPKSIGTMYNADSDLRVSDEQR